MLFSPLLAYIISCSTFDFIYLPYFAPSLIFGQQNFVDAGVDLRLVLLHPEDFRRSETSKRVVAGDAYQFAFAQPGADFVTLAGRALVVPEDRGAQDFPRCVQQHQPVHLAGQAHAHHSGWGVWKSYSLAAMATITPVSSMRSALVAVVDESMPMR